MLNTIITMNIIIGYENYEIKIIAIIGCVLIQVPLAMNTLCERGWGLQ